jgi:chloride channel protein, CIC family
VIQQALLKTLRCVLAATLLPVTLLAVRPPLPRTILIRLETGRLVVYSLLAGGLVGLIGSGWRLLLEAAINLGALVLGYRPPGTAGEGGLLIAFGQLAPYALLVLPALAAVYALLMPAGRRADPLNALVAGYHARGEWDGPLGQLRSLGATLLGHASGLLVGRDSTFTALGGVSALLLSRLARLDATERRILTLACVAAALGLVLHAPLAAAVLMAEVLYRRFEFEFEVLIPCVLAAICASAVAGLITGFEPLFALSGGLTPSAGQVPLYLLLATSVTILSLLLTRAADLVSGVYTRLLAASGWLGRRSAWWPPILRGLTGALFGLLVAVVALHSTPAVLGGGAGWLQLAVSGFLGQEAGGMAGWLWLLTAVGMQLAFGGGVLVSASVGGLMGVGLASLLENLGQSTGAGLDFPVAALIGAATCLTVTLNIPVAAALLAVTWGGDALLPAALASTALAHSLSGEASLLPSQVSRRADSKAHAQAGLAVLGRVTSPLRPLLAQAASAQAGLSQPLVPQTVAAQPGLVGVQPDVQPVSASADVPASAQTPGVQTTGVAEVQQRQIYRQALPRSWPGARIDLLTLPAGIELLSVVRGGQVRLAAGDLRLAAGDELLLLCTPAEFQSWQQNMRVIGLA